MAKQVINVGSSANDGTGDKIRVAFQKTNSNFDELYDAVDPANLISTDADNSIVLGTDNKLWSGGGGGGSVGTLQQVTDNGNTTTNAIEISNYIKASEFRSSADDITFTDGSGNPIFFFASTGANIANFDKALLTADRNFSLPDANGTIALTSNIPTVDATPTDGSSNAVSSNGVFDGLALKQDVLTETNFGAFMNARTAKNTLVDADEVVSDDSADSSKAKKTTWLNVWTNYIKLKTDALYQVILTEVNFGTFLNGLTAKTTPVDADTANFSDSADSNKAKKVSWENIKATLKTYFDGFYSVPCITITTSSSIDTDTTGSGYSQHGRNTKISNGANAINLTVQTSSNSDFVASYTKIGSSNITFVAGSGATLVQLSGTAVLSGAVGSTACLTRNGNIYYLQITNY